MLRIDSSQCKSINETYEIDRDFFMCPKIGDCVQIDNWYGEVTWMDKNVVHITLER